MKSEVELVASGCPATTIEEDAPTSHDQRPHTARTLSLTSGEEDDDEE